MEQRRYHPTYFPNQVIHLLRLVSYLLVHIDTMANKNKKFPTLVQKFYFQKFYTQTFPITEHASVPDMLPLSHRRNLQFRLIRRAAS